MQPPPSATTMATFPNMYAEFLPRLGRISVVVHLPTLSTHKTKVVVAKDAQHLILDHEGVKTALHLPVKTRIAGEHLPGEVEPGLMKMSWRLAPAPEEAEAGRHVTADGVPWSAAALRPGMNMVCRECDDVIVPGEKIRSFKDLPSENWAEMMEFWHCHKPTDGHGTGTARGEGKASEADMASRGYGANSTISSQSGVGFVDLMTILLSQEDCDCLMIPSCEPVQGSIVSQDLSGFRALDAHCRKCKTQLGRFDNRKNGISLFKWKLNLIGQAANGDPGAGNYNTPPAPPSLSQCLAAALVATQARSGSSRAVLQGEKEAVTVWILNPQVKFSCLAKQGVPAMKLLFQPKAMDEEEIVLPDQVVREVKQILEQGNDYLPPDEKTREFNPVEGPWVVSLLER